MRDGQTFYTPDEAFAQPRLHEKRCRSEHDHMERTSVQTVPVPEALDGRGPLRNPLDFVENQHRPTGQDGFGPRRFPAADDPPGVEPFAGRSRQRTRPSERNGSAGEGGLPAAELRRGCIGGEIQSPDPVLFRSRVSACWTMVVLPD